MPKFPISHVLIDCENVGLSDLADLVVNTDGTPLKFVLFHNSTNRINLSLTQLKDFGYALNENRVELVELAVPEKMTKKQAENSLDFYIAFYMGQVMPYEPFNSHCVILSKDHDYDPLVLHVQKVFGKDRCERVESYEALAKKLAIDVKPKEEKKPQPPKKQTVLLTKAAKNPPASKNFDLQKALEKAKSTLKGMSKNKPTTIKRLQNSLKSWFKAENPNNADLQSLIENLQKSGFLELSKDGAHVEYK